MPFPCHQGLWSVGPNESKRRGVVLRGAGVAPNQKSPCTLSMWAADISYCTSGELNMPVLDDAHEREKLEACSGTCIQPFQEYDASHGAWTGEMSKVSVRSTGRLSAPKDQTLKLVDDQGLSGRCKESKVAASNDRQADKSNCITTLWAMWKMSCAGGLQMNYGVNSLDV
ncbi:uncharacterized protein BDCG_01385 [Blastomyces dermatitidis ER-3]|uniref:Uncharacterized protein n=2 Tax=Blastomyces TaxID=229219 RepID=A0A179V2K8_BLAGS|nr:uncharacterized protein BDBG_09537 [Blastomyces gilchristii SLH14081]XP_045273849.1 uncharacterized protein BDCG_01385 [Blastomyces dermatitidis ER-3]EEQ86265.2 hypothetical protein BDCG_01385 [Blastomyces dermatitidis ER-3]EQL27970.1 hypothetical protein BDFG_09236 [Blastomyces dermatitidis ATCC 26199]OAT14546.1 hypothetical protein BDBG_09537 [Blastomyces gilchristii SLH14081]